MKQTKVIVVSFKGNNSVTYTEDGQFINIPRRKHHQVGQELLIKNQPLANHWNSSGWKTMIAAAAIMLLVFGLVNPMISPPAEAYFSLGFDKSSAELWLDKDNRVVDMKFKGSSQLAATDIKGKDVYQAVSVIASKAGSTGLLDSSGEDIIIINFADLSKDGNHHISEDKVKQAVLSSMNSGGKSPFMVMSRHDKGFMVEAGKLGLTASQYYVLEQSKFKGLSLTAEQLQNTSIRLALEEAGTTPEELFGMPEMHPDMNGDTQRGMMHPDSGSASDDLPGMDRKHIYDGEKISQDEPIAVQRQMEQSGETRMLESQYRYGMDENLNPSSMEQTQDSRQHGTNLNNMH
ncbi:MAG: hypothetical protein VR67_18130 [Peptococcaceae bacterium BRH_c8a]|nr:MAG: hypothetical protein VR67_18130 [Peptococcaceae bacterium BRH_c8a]